MTVRLASVVVGRRGAGQDRAVALAGPNGATLALADGAGGIGGGAIAAELAVSVARERLGVDEVDPAAILEESDALLHANPDAGESTLVVARVIGTRIVGASVGDSAAWLVGDAGFVDLTADQIRKPLLGSGRAHGTDFAGDLGVGALLVASDGLFDYAAPSTICRVVRSVANLRQAADQLVSAARLRSGELQDDVSVVLLRLDS